MIAGDLEVKSASTVCRLDDPDQCSTITPQVHALKKAVLRVNFAKQKFAQHKFHPKPGTDGLSAFGLATEPILLNWTHLWANGVLFLPFGDWVQTGNTLGEAAAWPLRLPVTL